MDCGRVGVLSRIRFRMNTTLVTGEITLSGKPLLTFGARIRFLSCVRTAVNSEVTWPLKCQCAYFAFILFFWFLRAVAAGLTFARSFGVAILLR